jgi:ABC-2 type transport system ATP-binding protein
MAQPLLATRELTKTFHGHPAVDRISLTVQEHSVYGLLGPNGAGKSTMLRMITGIARPTSGEVLYQGHPLTRPDLADIGAMIDQPAIYGNLSAQENMKVRALALGLGADDIGQALAVVRLTGTGRKKAKAFSMGMKQRLGIALALLSHPTLLVLDEPTNGLDPVGIQELRQLIRWLPTQGVTVIVSSHILSEVENTVDHVGIIAGGHLGYEGPLPEGHGHLEQLFMDVAAANQPREVR